MTTKKNLSADSQQRTSESLLKDIRRNTKRIFTSERKVLIVMEGIVVNRASQSSAISMVYPIVLTTNEIRNLLRQVKLALMVTSPVKEQVMR